MLPTAPKVPSCPTNVACRIRFVRGLALNTEGEYEDSRVMEIAKKQEALYKAIEDLDRELERISGKTAEEVHDEYWGDE